MVAKTRADDRDGATDVKLYLPAGITPPGEPSQLKRLWGLLFDNGGEPPK